MKRIKSILLLLAILIVAVCPVIAIEARAENGSGSNPSCDIVLSNDKLYKYAIDKETGDAYFFESLDKTISILNIPDEIDGHKIVGIKSIRACSKSLIRINFGNNVRYIFSGAFPPKMLCKTDVPISSINLNEGIKTIYNRATEKALEGYDLWNAVEKYKILILPKSLEYIGKKGFMRSSVDTLVFQSNPNTDIYALTVDDFEDYDNGTYSYGAKRSCDIYFTGNATNLNPFTFDYDTYIDLNEINSPTNYPSSNVTIYKNPSAKGFEKFTGSEYQRTLLDTFDSWREWKDSIELPDGYTVKEYTDEWWKDIKEIETVTLSAQSLDMKSGEKQTLKMNFAPQDAYDNRVFFVSLNTDIADVDMETGAIIAKTTGTVTVRAVAASGVYADCVVKVNGGGDAAESTSDEPTVSGASTEGDQTNGNTDNITFMTRLSENRVLVSAVAIVILTAVVVVVLIRKRKSA